MKTTIIAVLLLVTIGVSGCQTPYTPTGDCIDGESVILTLTGGNPTTLNKALMVVNLAAITSGTYTARQAEIVLDGVEAFLNGGASYSGLKDYLETQTAAAAVLILGDKITAIASMGAGRVITACDRQLILAHIANQRAILALC